MHIQVNGKQVDVGDALRSHVIEHIQKIAGKYAERAVDGAVTISRDGHGFKSDARIHLPTGLVAQASAVASDVYAAFEGSAERLEKQLRRYNRRLKDRHATKPPAAEVALEPVHDATSYVLREEDEEAAAPAEDGAEAVIVAEMRTQIDSMPVEDAVMRLNLTDAAFVIFRNPRHGGVNLVFRRDDGHIGWIDPDMLNAGGA